MALSLFLTTLFSAILFIPLAVFFYQSKRADRVANFVYGGATWSIVAIIQLIIVQIIHLIRPFEIANEISIDSIIQVQTEARTILFWYLFFISVIGQIILYLGTELTLNSDTAWDFAIYGFGWGISELVHRFLFLGSDNLGLQLYLSLYSVSVAVAIGSTIIRTAENTKFIMFASFLKFFGELSIFGGIGYQGDNLVEMIAVLVLILIMAGLSMLTRKYPLED